MIVGTAGHIDHGKTTLVRALTGVDTDRLPEEKKRGISIELGYAYLDTPAGRRIGFIDVPGHSALVHTMVAGASGAAFALLLVAADDGPMPQTHEHLAVLSLLGIARGAVVITKTDRASPDRLQALRAEMARLLQGTSLAGAPVVNVSAQTGSGIEALRQLLFDACPGAATGSGGRRRAGPAPGHRPRLHTGWHGNGGHRHHHAGSVRVGDELAISTSGGGAPLRARVRSLHAQNQGVQQAHAGQRCAVALAGLAREAVARGQWLTTPAVAQASTRLDMLLTLWPGEARALRSGAQVQAHIGAAHCNATVALLDAAQLAPGATALAQLVLQAPLGAWHGERVLLHAMHPPAAPSPAPGCWAYRPPRATGARRSAWPSWRRCSSQARQSVWPPCWPWPRRAWILAPLPPPSCCWRPRYQRARWPTTAGPWARRAGPWPAPRWPCCRAFTNATPTSSGPTARAGAPGRAASRARAVAGAAGAAGRCRPGGAARRRGAPAQPRRAAVGHRGAHRAKGRARARQRRLRGRLGARPGARCRRANPGAHHAVTPGAPRRAAPGGQGACSAHCPPWRNWPPWRARWARRTTAWYWRHSFAIDGPGAQAGDTNSGILRPHRLHAPRGGHAPAARRLRFVRSLNP